MDFYEATPITKPEAVVGECPIICGPDHIVWVDIPAGIIRKTNVEDGRSIEHRHHEPVGAVARSSRGEFIIAAGQGFYSLPTFGAQAKNLATVHQDEGVRFNDGKVDPWGRFVVGSACVGARARSAALFALDSSYSASQILSDVTMSNGLDWSPDRRYFYYVDTTSQRIDRFETSVENGCLGKRRAFAQIDRKLGLPDGLTVDAEENVWLAVWDGSCVLGFSKLGTPIARINVPASRPSSCTFGGRNLDTLFITSARADQDIPNDLGGALFAVRLPHVGQSERLFQDG